jgi:hypothetical protein
VFSVHRIPRDAAAISGSIVGYQTVSDTINEVFSWHCAGRQEVIDFPLGGNRKIGSLKFK